MKEIRNKFLEISENKTGWGTYTVLCEVIKKLAGRNKISNSLLRKAFLALVNRDEYDFKEKEYYIKYLYELNEKYNNR